MTAEGDTDTTLALLLVDALTWMMRHLRDDDNVATTAKIADMQSAIDSCETTSLKPYTNYFVMDASNVHTALLLVHDNEKVRKVCENLAHKEIVMYGCNTDPVTPVYDLSFVFSRLRAVSAA